jgi:hypothetical protein
LEARSNKPGKESSGGYSADSLGQGDTGSNDVSFTDQPIKHAAAVLQ